MTTEISPIKCPKCGFEITQATALFEENRPEDGDISICAECLEVCQFVADGGTLTLKAVTKDEFLAMPTEQRQQINLAIEGLQEVLRRRQARKRGLS